MSDADLPILTPARIAVIYTVVGLVWVVASDWVLGTVFASRALEGTVQTVKSVGFILASGGLVFALTRWGQTQLENRRRRHRESVTEMESVLEVSPHPVLQLDTDGRILQWNDAAEDVFGWAEAEVVGEKPPFVGDSYGTDYEQNVAHVAAGEAITREEITRLRKDGSSITLDLSAVPVHDADGNVTSIMAMLVDVSEYTTQQALLEDLLTAGEYIMGATSPEDVCERTLETAENVVNLPMFGLWRYDAADDALVPTGYIGESAATTPDLPIIEPGESVVWDVFESGDARAISRLPEEDALGTGAVPAEAELFVALGDNGVLVTGGSDAHRLGDLEFHMTRVLCSFADAAFERVEREQELITEREFVDTALDALDDIFIVIDPKTGEVIRWNDRLSEITEWTDQELDGVRIGELIAETDIGVVQEAIDNVVQTGAAEVELGIETEDGRVIDHEFHGQRLDPPNTDHPYVVAIGRDVTDQRALEQALKDNERRYRTLVEMSPVSVIVHADQEIVYANSAFLSLVQAESETAVLGTDIREFVIEEERDTIAETAAATQSGRATPSRNRYHMELDDGEIKHVETTSRPIAYEHQAAVLTIVEDITQRVHHEERVRSLHEITRELIATDSTLAAMTLAAKSCDELLDLPEAVVFVYEEAAGQLVPSMATEHQDQYLASVETVERGANSPVWHAFVSNEPQRITEPTPRIPFGSALVLPLGNYGVLVAGSMTPESVDEGTVELGEILRQNLRATLQRLDREETLAERDRELAVRNEELERLTRIEGIIRTVNRALINSRNREEIETAVCAELVESAVFAGAWIAEQSLADTTISAVTWDGINVEDIAETPSDDPLIGLIKETIEKDAVSSATDVLNDSAWTDRRAHALEEGYNAVAAIPIPVHGDVERVLVVHGTDPDLFTDRTKEVFTELGQLIGNALETVGGRQTVGATAYTRLEVGIDDPEFVLNRLTAATGGRFELRGVLPTDEGVNLFVTTSVSPTTLKDAIAGWDEIALVESTSDPSDAEEEGLVVLSVAEPLFEILSGLNISIRDIWTDDSSSTIVLDVPEGRDIRGVIDAIESDYTGVSLQSKTQQTERVETAETMAAAIEAACTERQLEALRAAYYGGYYEWPRKATNEALAESLGISSATYQSHRRTAERKLIEALLG